MRQGFGIFVALLCSVALAGPRRWADHTNAGKIDPMQSAGLFVGVRQFDDTSLTPVAYAVDDAVDLAFELTLNRQPALVDPKRVVLALSGEPQKPESQQKLRDLLGAGASRRNAGQSDILNLLESQSRAVGAGGILIAAFATHGVSVEGVQYLLTASSVLTHYHSTSLTEVEIRDTVTSNGVARSLIFVDACRERLTKDRRNGDVDPRSVAAFIRSMSKINGQVMFSAAAANGYAYDDDVRRNGVFTATVIEGLHCGANTNEAGYVTVDTLHSFVEKNVLLWLRAHKDPATKKATQWLSEGNSKEMPLSICVSHTASASQPRLP
jgi:hypothetical protein